MASRRPPPPAIPISSAISESHENTLEALIVFLPAVWIFALEVNYHFAVALGALFLIARIIYASGYLSAANKRASGALATAAVNGVLVLGSVIAIIIKAL